MEKSTPKTMDQESLKLGRNLIYHFFVLLKTAKNYKFGHAAMNSPVSKILDTVSELKRMKEEASLRLKGGYLFLGDQRLKPDQTGTEAFNFTIAEMKQNYMGGIILDEKVSADDIGHFAYLFGEPEPIPSPDTYQRFLEKMEGTDINGITVEEFTEKIGVSEEEATEDNKEKSKKLYAKTLHAVAEVMDDVKIGQTLKLRKSKRVIQGMIDQMLTAETNLIGLTTIRCHDEYTYHHSVNVCILSLAIAQRIGLNRATLCDLGISALFHDIGKSDIPIEILNKPASFTEEEWAIMQTHPLHGVKELMRLKGLDTLSARIITGAFEHHINLNHSGYPKVGYTKELSLFGRIIAIADCYDGVTSSRVYSRKPMTPDKALKFMLERAGTIYDPILMKLFVNCIGVYPIGSLLVLSTKELAVVMQSNPDPSKWKTPQVKIISTADGAEVDGETVDLAGDAAGRSILKTMNAEEHDIDVTKYFL